MVVVRLVDGTVLFGFSPRAFVARRSGGVHDRFWERAAAASVEEHEGDLTRGICGLPGATPIYEAAIATAPAPRAPTPVPSPKSHGPETRPSRRAPTPGRRSR